MSEYMRGYFDVYALTLAVMKSQKDMGIPINEGICFERVEDGN